VKIPAMRRAVQLLVDSTAPGASDVLLVFADAADTLVANDPRAGLLKATLRSLRLRADEDVLVSAECNSWPRCYTQDYERAAHTLVSRCIQDHQRGQFAACFPNSGVYAGTGTALLSWLAMVGSTAAVQSGVEHDDDQAAVQRVLLANRRPQTVLDSSSSLFLSLYPCPFSTSAWNLSSSGDAPCPQSRRGHLPIEHVRGRGLNLTLYDGSVLRHGRLRRPRRPLLVHGNGLHWSLDVLLSQWEAQSNASVGGPGLKPQLWPPHATLLDHPVLLLDSRSRGVCNVSTLGELLPPGVRKMSRHVSRVPERLRARGHR